MELDTRNLVKKAVVICGTQTELANRIGGSVKQQHVWRWINTTKVISPERAKQIEKAVNGEITKEQLRPDFFDF